MHKDATVPVNLLPEDVLLVLVRSVLRLRLPDEAREGRTRFLAVFRLMDDLISPSTQVLSSSSNARSRDSLFTPHLQIATHKGDSSDIDCLYRSGLHIIAIHKNPGATAEQAFVTETSENIANFSTVVSSTSIFKPRFGVMTDDRTAYRHTTETLVLADEKQLRNLVQIKTDSDADIQYKVHIETIVFSKSIH
ncbi:hypothetical protein CLF_106275 [Clonorchis sinensis]|uniref:Uncharacterized protein n=1 Tax=Clonorchis sinensis TaxID=79923 RepID=G7YPU1_CLOSI|nr:hypothetical protein CLF_106275 [Clonorchis sinensis]